MLALAPRPPAQSIRDVLERIDHWAHHRSKRAIASGAHHEAMQLKLRLSTLPRRAPRVRSEAVEGGDDRVDLAVIGARRRKSRCVDLDELPALHKFVQEH